jgi:hypothetical protein
MLKVDREQASIQEDGLDRATRRIRSAAILLQALISHIPPGLFDHAAASSNVSHLSPISVASEMYSTTDPKASTPSYSPSLPCRRFRSAALGALLSSVSKCAEKFKETTTTATSVSLEQQSEIYISLMDVISALASMGRDSKIELDDWRPEEWLNAVLGCFKATRDFEMTRSSVDALVALNEARLAPKLKVDRRDYMRIVVGKVRERFLHPHRQPFLLCLYYERYEGLEVVDTGGTSLDL